MLDLNVFEFWPHFNCDTAYDVLSWSLHNDNQSMPTIISQPNGRTPNSIFPCTHDRCWKTY